MSYSFSTTSTQTFTATHAKYLASKVVTDLKRMQRFYSYPTDFDISEFEAELVEFLKKGYLESVIYGFQKDGKWIEPTLSYTAKELGGSGGSDDDPGRITPSANVSGASFCSYLTYSQAYRNASQSDRESFAKELPFNRTTAEKPGFNGYLTTDRSYSSGGKSLDRSSLKSF